MKHVRIALVLAFAVACSGKCSCGKSPADLGAAGADGGTLDGGIGDVDREAAKELIDQVPATSPGARSPEEAARTYVTALATRNEAQLKSVMIAKDDIGQLVAPETQLDVVTDNAKIILDFQRWEAGRKLQIVSFEKGEMTHVPSGKDGLTQDVDAMTGAKINAKLDGEDAQFLFDAILKRGDVWKVIGRAELKTEEE